MRIPRRHYLALAGVGEQLFKTLQRRDQVPLIGVEPRTRMQDEVRDDLHEEADAGGYSAGEAIMLAAADRLVSVNSFSRDAAKVFIERHPEMTFLGIKRIEAGEEIWIGAYDGEGGGNGGGMVARGRDGSDSHVPIFGTFGTLDEVMATIKGDLERFGEEGRAISLLNLTPIVRRAKAVAEQVGCSGSLLPKIG